MALPAPPKANRRAWPALLTLTDDLLEDIFLRVPTPADLARACTACATFRRIITNRSFLRRFRAVHPPPLLGFIPCFRSGFLPAQPPYPSAPLGRAVADAADFSYSFVREGKWKNSPWMPCDVRQGRVLLKCCRNLGNLLMSPSDVELVVCDPIFRRFVVLPPIPDDLVDNRRFDLGHLLAPTARGEDEVETSFKVICTAANHTTLVAFVYSSVTGHWCIASSRTWASLGIAASSPCPVGLSMFDYSQGYFFWTFIWRRSSSLMLDPIRMEFSIVQNVPKHSPKFPVVAVGTEGIPEMFILSDDSFHLLHFDVAKGNEPSNDK